MVGYYYKTGAEIYSILRFMKNSLNLSYKPSASSIEVIKMYADKKYRFSFFLNERKEIVYLIEQLSDDRTDYSKEEKPMTNMTKEEALKKIEELKAFVEKLDEEIPEMPSHGAYNIHIAVPDEQRHLHISWDRSFENEESAGLYSILTFELAQLVYAREHLKVDGEKLLRARKHGDMVFKVIFDVADSWYEVVDVFGSQVINENDRIWCFTNVDDANKVRDYMNKYVAHVKKNMF